MTKFVKLPVENNCGRCNRLLCEDPPMCGTLQRLIDDVEIVDDMEAGERIRQAREGLRV